MSITMRALRAGRSTLFQLSRQAGLLSRVAGLELITADIESDALRFAPVDLIYAALLLEYVDVRRVLERLHDLLVPGGMLATVVQLPGAAPVTPSPFASLETLASVMRLVDPEDLEHIARAVGYRETERRREQARGGKHFEVQVFRAEDQGGRHDHEAR